MESMIVHFAAVTATKVGAMPCRWDTLHVPALPNGVNTTPVCSMHAFKAEHSTPALLLGINVNLQPACGASTCAWSELARTHISHEWLVLMPCRQQAVSADPSVVG